MKLSTYLKRKDISQTAFAKTLGIQQGVVSRWVTLGRIPNPILIAKVEKATRGAVTLKDWVKNAKW